MKVDDIIIDEKFNIMLKAIGEAHMKYNKDKLTYTNCPKCQFEDYKNNKCNHCGFTKEIE